MDPNYYEVSYDFTGFQNNSPTSPLPAPRLDDELLNIATSIASLVDAVKSVRRSDGQLVNEIVTYDSLSLALKLMLDPTNAELVAGAVAAAQAAAASAGGSSAAAAISAAAALVSEINAAASAATVNLSLYLPKSGNLAGMGSYVTARSNMGLGTAAVLDVGTAANRILQLDGSAKIPAVDGSQLYNIDVLPIGSVIFAFSIIPLVGTLELNGSLLSRATFARLWNHAQSGSVLVNEATWPSLPAAYSNGDLATSFRIPDIRGEFVRVWDNSRGVDAGRAMGAVQLDTFKDHTHTTTAAVQSGSQSDITPGSVAGAVDGARVSGGASTGAGTETRPRNIPLIACVKAY